MNMSTINAERFAAMEQALQKIAAMTPGEYETEVEGGSYRIQTECDTCEEMQEIARKALKLQKPELTDGAYKASFTEELIDAGYNQENPVPYHEPVEIDRHKMFIFGSCVGVALTERRENDPHVAITYLVEDDGFWSVLSGPISAYWVDDMLDLIKFMRNYMRHSGKFKELKDGYGYEWKDFDE